jgi:hypothetical protein
VCAGKPSSHVLGVFSALLVAACRGHNDSGAQQTKPPSAASVQRCDSARAASVAIDSLSHLDRFKSELYRYEPDSAGVRIVTWPAPDQHLIDGMAIIRVDRACRMESLIQTDSA